jgi:hypothetical protein
VESHERPSGSSRSRDEEDVVVLEASRRVRPSGSSRSRDEEDVVVLEASRRVRVRSPKTLSAAYPELDH